MNYKLNEFLKVFLLSFWIMFLFALAATIVLFAIMLSITVNPWFALLFLLTALPMAGLAWTISS